MPVASPSPRLTVLAALTVALVTGLVYRSTMLPGLDLGDTPSFQTMGGSPFITPRDAYPLYFLLSAPLVWAVGDPAAGMNLASVVAAALSCGAIVLLSAELSGAILPSIVAALCFAASTTFWSQAVTAEVYALHVLCITLVLLALLHWERKPTLARLALVFLTYAAGFGNHLTMVLLLPAVGVFLIRSPSGGLRALTRGRVVLVAIGSAAIGALPYFWNLRNMLLNPVPPAHVAEAARWFWFDVTKSDWRDTMILDVPGVMAAERARMFVFDLRQQFGVLALLLALAGVFALAKRAPHRCWLLTLIYAAATAFALTYNVGDTHVFLLPAHLMIALAIAPGLVWVCAALPRAGRVSAPAIAGALAAGAACARLYAEYPAQDRSGDRRAERTFHALAGDLGDHHALLVGDLDWQLQNGLNYYTAHTRDDLAYTTLTEILPYAPTFVADNQAIGRETFVTGRAPARLAAAYGPLLDIALDERLEARPLHARAERLIAQGGRYVLCVLKPVPDVALDRRDLEATLRFLTGGRMTTVPAGDYVAIAGLQGHAPALVRAGNQPFTDSVRLDGTPVRIRMDAWLAFDTIRRMGFGQVIADRRHALIVERGVSLATFGADGHPDRPEYAAGLYAPPVRWRVTSPR